ncbi:MAG: GNAT family N-acetyltransferase [Candidatus Eisenbacteria bacterium]
MATVRRYCPQDRDRWDAYVRDNAGSHFGQAAAWLELTAETYGVPGHHWLAEEAGSIRGILPLFRKGGRTPSLFSAPGGLLADDHATAAELLVPVREQVARERLAYAELRDQKHAWPDLATVDEHLTMVLELQVDTDSQWKGFDAKLRNQIRKGEKAGFELRTGHGAVEAFHRVMLENMRDLGTPLRGLPYFRRALEKLGSAADILVIGHQGQPAGAMFTVAHRDTLMDPWASSLRRYFKDCPNQVLYWAALQSAIRQGLRRFDFGRSQWGSNTFRFKEQWGAQPVALHYQYVLGTAKVAPTLESQKGSLDAAVKLWRKLPLPLVKLLGEPAKRMFPEVL